MDRQIKRLGIALLVCFTALFGQLNYLQLFGAERLKEGPGNSRREQRSFARPRGQIMSADDLVLARSVPIRSRFKFERQYPQGDLFGPITGYYSFTLGATGVERSYGEDLAGATPELRFAQLSDLFVDRQNVGDVRITLRADVQRVARLGLGDRLGAVVALDPRSGAVDALWSNPTFDPGPLSTNTEGSTDLKAALDDAPGNPLLSRAYRDIFFPGSTFKVVTAATAVERGTVTEQQPVYPVRTGFDIDFTQRNLSNFGGASCGGPLYELLKVSCNSGFAQLGVELGPDAAVAGAEAFGFNDRVPFDLPGGATSRFPTEFPDDQGNGPLARASIGQGDVSSTPLQMALVAAGLANGGSIMTPHVLDEVADDEGKVVKDYEEDEWRRAVSPRAADVIRRGMVAVVDDGTAAGLAIEGMEVGGKTGTAQLGTDPPQSHAWIIGFAGPPGQPAQVAVAVMVQAQPGASEQTGGRVAAPIAKAVMEAVLAARREEGGG